jgi:phospholipid/cholesterol/gamma-HCH transport system substrate-binding protein
MMMANLSQAAVNSKKVTEDFKQFSAKLNNNESLVGQLLSDTVVFSNLQSAVEQLQGITETATSLTSNLSKASEQLNEKDNSIGVLLNDEEVADQLKRTLDNLEGSTQKLDRNMEALQHNFLLRGFFRKEAKKAAKETLKAEN